MIKENLYNSPNVANRIKAYAKTKAIPLKTILDSCELGSNTFSHMLHGRSLAFDSLARIADYLNCSVDYLLGRTDIPEINTHRAQDTRRAHDKKESNVISITPQNEFTGELAAFGGDIQSNPQPKDPETT